MNLHISVLALRRYMGNRRGSLLKRICPDIAAVIFPQIYHLPVASSLLFRAALNSPARMIQITFRSRRIIHEICADQIDDCSFSQTFPAGEMKDLRAVSAIAKRMRESTPFKNNLLYNFIT